MRSVDLPLTSYEGRQSVFQDNLSLVRASILMAIPLVYCGYSSLFLDPTLGLEDTSWTLMDTDLVGNVQCHITRGSDRKPQRGKPLRPITIN
jgi:hypothetical protein